MKKLVTVILAFCLILLAGTVYGQKSLTQKKIEQEPSVKVEVAKQNIQKVPVTVKGPPIIIQKAPVPPKGQPVKAEIAKQDLQVTVNSVVEKTAKVEGDKSEAPKAETVAKKR